MAGAARRLTGLTGLAVEEEPLTKLVNLYGRTLRVLAKMPKDAAYRVNTQAIVQTRLQHIEKEKDIGVLERKINCGKIEEVIRQAERELHLARNMVQFKPWEPLIAPPPKYQFQWPPV